MDAYGYAGKILKVDLSSGKISEIPTMQYAERFLGGRGIAAGIYWDEVPPEIDAFDERNRLIFATGPFCTMPAISGSRWVVCGKSPSSIIPGQFSYGNLGGHWGAALKFAGYDAVVVYGKAENPAYLLIDDNVVKIKDAASFWGKGAIDTREALKSELGQKARVVCIGPGGENMVAMATLTADNDASASAGMGAVMGSKKLKAVVVRATGKRPEMAYPERYRELTDDYRNIKRHVLPLSPNRFSENPMEIIVKLPGIRDMKWDRCYGCLTGCGRLIYEAKDGTKGKFMCDSAMFYQPRADAYYGEWNDVSFFATKLCDNYGLDSWAVDLIISWLELCHKAGIMSDEGTGLPISESGSMEFIEALTRKIALREGFGEVLAQGLDKAAASVGPDAEEQIKYTGFCRDYGVNDPYSARLYNINALLYATEPRVPIQQLHEVGWVIPKWVAWLKKLKVGIISTDSVRAIARTWFGGESALDFSTLEGKALAARMIQDRQYAKECLILCDFLWPIREVFDTENPVGDPSFESKFLSAVTGREVDVQGLNTIGERVLNLQRAIHAREGSRGRESDVLPEMWHTVPLEHEFMNVDMILPGKGDDIISRKGGVVDREEFEKLKSDYYELRHWDVATGFQTRTTLDDLGLNDVAADLEQRGLLA